MFFSDHQEIVFFRNLTAYEEEFGVENLTISVPVAWIDSPMIEIFSGINTRVWNANAVCISVKGLTASFMLVLGE